jgi:flagellar motor switch protein FliN/FliY
MPSDDDDIKEMDVQNPDFSENTEDVFDDTLDLEEDSLEERNELEKDLDDPQENEIYNADEEEVNNESPSKVSQSHVKTSEAKITQESLKKASISDLPVRVQVEVSRFEVSLDELVKMEPGYKLPVEINPNSVNLTVNGKLIGKGEIVEIGHQIGVRITELYK